MLTPYSDIVQRDGLTAVNLAHVVVFISGNEFFGIRKDNILRCTKIKSNKCYIFGPFGKIHSMSCMLASLMKYFNLKTYYTLSTSIPALLKVLPGSVKGGSFDYKKFTVMQSLFSYNLKAKFFPYIFFFSVCLPHLPFIIYLPFPLSYRITCI